ncbi:bifunctional diaminohydroxyphosphoribosylaminopyrimidine deaminase/5-amino-6-(5-phosphoribosylamino)uracil reductase RibD, partial [Candidatus Bipolaricaulota bacterium]|nr:bifunctional diaminohydroxyphosphoribosylaminopyrimidine deaminase/5-amino-6-(5-phosphoribosylamino)uracil reductase RibD [Candidatus Bipolaricaulota bacterium]
MNDEYYMQIALDLARKGTGFVNPNPLVGAIIVKNGAIIGRGYHKTFGGPHAEVFALEQAAEEADGATMYVTLEPCCHQGKTPPCTRRIVAAGIRCVVVACRDPNPLVNGQGITSLQGAGVEVREGALRKEAQQVNEIFLRFITTGIPFTQLKLAMSLDGKIATKRGDSKWISGEQSREEVHRMRGRFASVLVGSNTVIVDDPRLTVRHVSGKNPIRIVLDQHGLIPITSRIFHSEERTIVVTGAMPA